MEKEKFQELLEGSQEIIEKVSLQKKLESKKILRVKYGIDPTGFHLHLGHAVILEKLRQFQNLGHKIVLLIGDFTARFGDPTARETVRKGFSKEKIEKFMAKYLDEAGVILDIPKTEIRYNSHWYEKMDAQELLKLMSHFTHAQLIERDFFAKRFKARGEIRLNEIVYPVLQAYDSVVIKSDLTVIGLDQKFNELQARHLQTFFGQPPQDLMLMPILLGTDGKNKMSMTLGNFIGIKENPVEQFGKLMSIPDELILSYYKLLTRKTIKEKEDFEKRLQVSLNPRNLKEELAQEVVSQYHSKNDAVKARDEFKKVFQLKQPPSKISVVKLEGAQFSVVNLLIKTGLVPSRSEARRLITQGAVKVDGKKIDSPDLVLTIKPETILQVGKRKFIKLG